MSDFDDHDHHGHSHGDDGHGHSHGDHGHDHDDGEDFDDEGPEGFGVETVYPVNEETEVPYTGGQLFKTVLVEGRGTATPPSGAKVDVHYVGTLLSDGSKFDSSRDRGEPFTFTIGQGQVIKGWDKGVATMKKGEKAILKCLSEYAYGASGSPPKIPPHATLNFEVELLGWTKSDDVSAAHDRSIVKSVLHGGAGYDHPDYEAVVKFTAAVLHASESGEPDAEGAQEIAAAKDFQATIGETDLPRGLEDALKSMKKGESAVVLVAARVAATTPAGATALFEVPAAGVEFQYVLTLHEMIKVRPWEFAGAAKVAEGVRRKDEGNAYFKAGRWAHARGKYKRALEFVEHEFVEQEGGVGEAHKAEARKLTAVVLTNLAQVELNAGAPKDCVTQCDKALGIEPASVKALFKRGKARFVLGDWDEAVADFKRVLELDASNVDAQRELAAVQETVRAHNQKQKQLYSKLFA